LQQDIKSVHFIRSIASTAVCIFHLFCGNNRLFDNNNFFKKTFSYGYLGVEMFFILSGFIICYVLPKNFHIKQFYPFIKRRLIRIEPPYIASIILLLVLNHLSHNLTGINQSIDWTNAFFHLAYLNSFNLGPYLNPVYWTLGIEFQFYILIALFFPLINKTKHVIVFMFLSLMLPYLNAYLPEGYITIIPYTPLFGLGILLYFYKFTKLIDRNQYVIITAFLLVQVYFYFNISFVLVSFLTLLILNFWKLDNRIITYLSKISFSLYLTHVIIGGKIINLGLRFFQTEFSRYFLFLIAFSASILFAHLFYLIFEKPAINFSKRINYAHNKAA